MPPSTVSFSIADDLDGFYPSIDIFEAEMARNSIDGDLISVCVGVLEEDSVDFMFTQEQTAGDLAILSAVVASHPVTLAKFEKVKDIDARTDQLIDAGFQYAGKQFSLSIPAQSKMTSAHQLKDHVLFLYPVVWNTIYDDDAYTIPDSADMDGFYLTAVGTIRAYLDSGTSLKDAVRAATTIVEVDAVVDPR